MSNVIWKDVVGYNGKYQVSSEGQVRSVFLESKLGKRTLSGTIMKYSINKNGYKALHLGRRIDGVFESKTRKIHRLVCEAFHDNPENKPQVNHKDLDTLNNCADNLEWCTAKENVHHAQINGRMPLGRKEYVKKGRPIGLKKIININTGETFVHAKALHEATGIPIKNIRRSLCGERYNYTPYRYVGQEDTVKLPTNIEGRKNKVAVFDINWNHIASFDYFGEAATMVHCNTNQINEFLRGGSGQVKGFKFKRIGNDGNFIEPVLFQYKPKPVKKIKIKGVVPDAKKLIKLDLNNKELKRFNSIGEAARAVNADVHSFRKAIRKSPRNYYKGFIYRYA